MKGCFIKSIDQKTGRGSLLILLLCMVLLQGIVTGCQRVDQVNAKTSAAKEQNAQEIVVLYTTNVNCAIEDGITYAGVAGYKKKMEKEYSHVTLVDCGDYLSGGMIGSINEGEYPVRMMNQVGYDMAVVGNREFDYGVDRLLELQKKMKFSMLSCNFVDTQTGQPVFASYKINEYGKKKVAFIGVSMPLNDNVRVAGMFRGEDGSLQYSFCKDDKQQFYDQVQKTVQEVQAQNVDYVIALTHLGDETKSKLTVYDLIAHTSGIDVVLDGQSVQSVESATVSNVNGDEVLLSRAGNRLSSMGKLVLSDHSVTAALEEQKTVLDVDTEHMTETIVYEYLQKTEEVVAQCQYNLMMKDQQDKEYMIRRQETNLGDLCADAYREVMMADIGLVAAGSVNGQIEDGSVSYQDIQKIFPYEQQACLIEATGQQVLEALEVAASDYPYNSRHFLQVAGIRYKIDSSVNPGIQLDEDSNDVYMSDHYRVNQVEVYNRESGSYEPLSLTKTYRVALSNYMYKSVRSGYSMFRDCRAILDEEMSDVEVLVQYLRNNLNGQIGQPYENVNGQGRIQIQ